MILLELDPDNYYSIEKTYVYANDQVIMQYVGDKDGTKYFYLHDRLGSVRQIIDTSGDVKNRYTYNPFGEDFPAEIEENITNPFRFAGQYYDSEIEQYYLRARQYDPYISRFTARDPVLGSFTEPLTLHAYLYSLNNPVNNIDPSGELSYAKQMTAVKIMAAIFTAIYVTYEVTDYAFGGFIDAISMRNTSIDLAISSESINDILWDVALDTSFWALAVYSKAKDSSKDEPHGDAGRAIEKAKKQIAELRDKLKNATGREAKRIRKKIQRIWQDAQKKAKGETHHRK